MLEVGQPDGRAYHSSSLVSRRRSEASPDVAAPGLVIGRCRMSVIRRCSFPDFVADAAMEAAITVPTGGTVSRTAFDRIVPVEGGDLLLVVDVDNAAKREQPPDRSAEIVGVGC